MSDMNHHAQLVRVGDLGSYQHIDEHKTAIKQFFERFGIDEARVLASQAQLRPSNPAGQVFVVVTSFVTHEAQNALLKLFEEPPADTYFVLVVPHALQLLPTLLSRFGSESFATHMMTATALEAFVQASYADRIKQIEAWQKSKDSQWLGQITAGIHALDVTGYSSVEASAIRLVGERLLTRGASNKMLLEHLALVVPLQN